MTQYRNKWKSVGELYQGPGSNTELQSYLTTDVKDVESLTEQPNCTTYISMLSGKSSLYTPQNTKILTSDFYML